MGVHPPCPRLRAGAFDGLDRRLLRQRPDGVVLGPHAGRAAQPAAAGTPASSWPTPSSSTLRSSTTGNDGTHHSGCSARSSTSSATPTTPPAIKPADRAKPGAHEEPPPNPGRFTGLCAASPTSTSRRVRWVQPHRTARPNDSTEPGWHAAPHECRTASRCSSRLAAAAAGWSRDPMPERAFGAVARHPLSHDSLRRARQ